MALWDSHPERVWQKRFYDFNVWSERNTSRSCVTCIGIR
jgi:hypothetical protein